MKKRIKICILFGGSGYIGSKIIERFVENNRFDKIIQADIQKPTIDFKETQYIYIDVRNSITDIDLGPNIDKDGSWIFNLAAIHREPGHEANEYFDTNINGANNVVAFAEKTGIKNIYFTSSIAPYGRSYEQRDESSMLYSETPYGISKGYAEKIHQLWNCKDETKKLVICRPSVIYGPGDPGNVLRMVRGILSNTFFYPGNSEIIKGYGYIYGLIDSVEYVCFDKSDREILYNYAENPVLPMKDLGLIVKKVFGVKRVIPTIPTLFLVLIAGVLQLIGKPFGKFSSIHPVRVKKAGFPTNIKPRYLIENGFEFKYGFEKSLNHWRMISPDDFK